MKFKRVRTFFFACRDCARSLGWWFASTLCDDLPSPLKTWDESKLYLLSRGRSAAEMDQGMGRLDYSLIRVAYGFFIGILIGKPLGFSSGSRPRCIGCSIRSSRILRPFALAWLLPRALCCFRNQSRRHCSRLPFVRCGRRS